VYRGLGSGDRAAGRITLELRADLLPITCENFRTLCTGEFGLNKDGRTLMHYKGCPFHRITPAQLCQSGDIKSKDGALRWRCAEGPSTTALPMAGQESCRF